MSPRFVLGRQNVPCVAEVVNRWLKADCTDFTTIAQKFKQSLVFRSKRHNAGHILQRARGHNWLLFLTVSQNSPDQIFNGCEKLWSWIFPKKMSDLLLLWHTLFRIVADSLLTADVRQPWTYYVNNENEYLIIGAVVRSEYSNILYLHLIIGNG